LNLQFQIETVPRYIFKMIANAVASGVSFDKLLAAQTVFSATWLLRLALIFSGSSHQAL
jgi:hypothetical protein